MFESLGLAIEDLAAARHVHQEAIDADAGTEGEIGGKRQEGA